MARLKQSQSIDLLIQSINKVAEDRCSLSDEDLIILNEALSFLENMKERKGKTNKILLEEAIKVVQLLSKYFCSGSSNKDDE